jgi:hypothetical protein
MKWKGFGRKPEGLDIDTIPALSWRECRKPGRTSASIADVQDQIGAERLSNTCLKHYRHTYLLRNISVVEKNKLLSLTVNSWWNMFLPLIQSVLERCEERTIRIHKIFTMQKK